MIQREEIKTHLVGELAHASPPKLLHNPRVGRRVAHETRNGHRSEFARNTAGEDGGPVRLKKGHEDGGVDAGFRRPGSERWAVGAANWRIGGGGAGRDWKICSRGSSFSLPSRFNSRSVLGMNACRET